MSKLPVGLLLPHIAPVVAAVVDVVVHVDPGEVDPGVVLDRNPGTMMVPDAVAEDVGIGDSACGVLEHKAGPAAARPRRGEVRRCDLDHAVVRGQAPARSVLALVPRERRPVDGEAGAVGEDAAAVVRDLVVGDD